MSYRAEIEQMLRTMPSDWKRQWALARQELRRLDYDPPAQPDASDVLQALYLTAGGRASGDKVVGSVPVPPAVRDEAMRAVRMAHRHNYGAWHMIGLARAMQLATVPRIDTRSVERMRAFFTRHAKDARAPHFGDDTKPSRGYLAHLVWGGDPAKEWVMSMEKRMRRNPSDVERALAGDKYLVGANLQGAYLRMASLQQYKLQYADLRGADLRGADLQEVDFRWADLQEADLQGANLQGANLQRSKLQKANLHGANLQGTNLQGANLQRSKLQKANLHGAKIQKANLQGADLQEADLQGADLQEADLREADLRWGNLREADLRWGNLREADLQEADFRWGNLRETDLRETNLRDANLQGANLEDADLEGAALEGAKFTGATTKGMKGITVPRKEIAYPESKSFDAWFGKSVLRDAKGRPLVLYHGTDKGGFTAFDLSKIDPSHVGFFLSDDPRLAQTYTSFSQFDPFGDEVPTKKGIYRLFVKMENPFVYDAQGSRWNAIPWGKGYKDFVHTSTIGIWAKQHGYDGVILNNTVIVGPSGIFYEPSTVYIVFDPRNIKSAAYNRGTWDPTDPDIRHNPRPARRNPLAKADIDTPAFRRWFGNSKVVDIGGRPRVVYHGTGFGTFDAFREDKQSKPGFFFSDDKKLAATYVPGLRDRDPLAHPISTFAELKKYADKTSKTGFVKLVLEGDQWVLIWEGERLITAPDTREGKARMVQEFRKLRGPGVYAVYLKMERPLEIDAGGSDWDRIANPIDLTTGDFFTTATGRRPYTTDGFAVYAKAHGYDGLIVHNVVDTGNAYLAEPFPGTVYVVFQPNQIKSVYNAGTFDASDRLLANPRPARRNPPAKPTERMGLSFYKDRHPGVLEVYLYDVNDLDHPERAMVGGMMVALTGKKPRWEASGVAACKGYGPLVYDLAASLLQQRVHATQDQSAAAKAFWAKQKHRYIDPLTPEQFRAKYGVTVRDLYAQGADLTPEELQRMSDELTTVFFAAREAEAAGKPVALARCRPNRRLR